MTVTSASSLNIWLANSNSGRRRAQTCFPSVSQASILWATNMVPHSHEVQDMLIRVDEQIGALLTSLDQLVGRDRYVVALSSDHGVALVPEQDGGVVAGSGRMSSTAIRTMINTAIESVIGPGTHVMARTGRMSISLQAYLSRILGTAGARESITRAIVSFEA